MSLFRFSCLLTTLVLATTLSINGQVQLSQTTDDACQNETKSVSPITITEQINDDFNLTNSVAETLVFEPTSGTFIPGVGTVSYTTGNVNAQITVTSSQIVVSLEAATGSHASNPDVLTISDLQITSNTQESIEIRYVSGTASVNGLSVNDPVAYIDFHLIPVGANDNVTICGDDNLNYDLQFNVSNLGNNVISNFTWAAVDNPNVSGEGADGSTQIYDILSNVTSSAEVVTYDVIPTSLSGACVGATFQINVTVNPRIQIPGFTKSTSFSEECVNNVVTYTTDPGYTTYSWSVLNEASITSGGSSTDNFVTVQWPSTATTGSVTITNINSFGCATQPVGFPVEVRDNGPTASNTSATDVCSNVSAFFDIQSYTASSHFYAFTPVDNPQTTGESAGNNLITDAIFNPTSTPQNIVYTVTGTHSVSGCIGTPFTVTLGVNPMPIGDNVLTDVCSGVALNENPQNIVNSGGGNGVTATTFNWTSSPDPEVTGSSGAGTGVITELLTNTTADLHGIVYTIYGTTSLGCIGPAFDLTVHVNPPPKISGPTSICTASDVTFFATNPGTTFSWGSTGSPTVVSGGGSGDSFIELNWAAGTEVSATVIYENSYGCSGLAQLSGNLTTLVPDAPGNGIGETCSSVSAAYNLQSLIVPPVPANFSWVAADNTNTTGESLTPIANNLINDIVINTQGGGEDIVYTVTPTGACGTGDPFTVTITTNPEPVATGATTETCSGAFINFDLTLSVTNGVTSTFEWRATDNPNTNGESLSFITSSMISDNPNLSEQYTSEVIVYTVRPRSSDLCYGANFTINSTIQAAPSAAQYNGVICSGLSAGAVLQAHIDGDGNSVPSTFSWYADDAPNVTGESLAAQSGSMISDVLDVTGVPKQTVTYYVTATSIVAGCTGSVFTALVEVNEIPQAPNNSETLCSGVGQSFDINAHYIAGGGIIPVSSFAWLAADNPNTTGETHPLQSSTVVSDIVLNATDGGENVVYTITAMATNGCIGTFTRTLTVNPLPSTLIANAVPTISSTASTNITLTSNVSGATFSYTVSAPPEISGASPGAGSSILQALTNSTTIQRTVTYTITATANGCLGAQALASIIVRGDPTMNQSDSLALVALYNALNGANWTVQTNWLSGPADTWSGVSVSSERLTALSLPTNNLTGSFPVAFFDAPMLELLDLKNNNINGSLPAEISSLTALQILDLQNNQMDGVLPNSLFFLIDLTQLYLRGNNFTGSIPSTISNLSSLQTLQAEGLPMDGPIPSEVFGLTSLVNLGLSGKINGPLPATIGNLTSLMTFNCDSCAITSLPSSLGGLTNLTSLRLQNNTIQSLPDLSGLPLSYLDVSKNSLTFESLEPHVSIPTFVYIPQDTVGIAATILLQTTTPHTFNANVGGSANQYVWRKNNVVIPGATASTYSLGAPVFEDEGNYEAEVTSSLVPGLTLKTALVTTKVSSLKRDSLSLLQIYNSTNGPSWTSVSGWKTGLLASWSGVVISSNRVTGLNLSGKGLTGALPEEFTDMRSLQTANLSGNNLTSIPAVASMTNLTNLNVASNAISFGSLEPNASALSKLTYSPQNVIGVVSRDSIPAGSSVEFSAVTSGANNLYQWKRNNSNVTGGTSGIFGISSLTRQTMGEYYCEITNSVVPNLTLQTAKKTVLATADLSGKIKITTENPATKGIVTLLRVNTSAKAFEKIKVRAISDDGTYSFLKVVLDNYQILAFADTITYVGALPTYYKNTLLWEEADTLFVNENLSNLDITSIFEPGPATGRGQISGVVQEEETNSGGGGRTKLPKPVKQVGVSARRVQNTGRGQDEILTLVAYVFTNDDGEFSLPNLPTGNYRLNIQYPGYPMDEKSFINFTIGTGLTSEIKVEALVDKGVINVRQLIITGIWSKEDYAAEVFPNPTSSVINMTFETTSPYRDVGIFDVSGKEIRHIDASSDKVEINVGDFSKGMYLINVTEKGSLVKSVHVIIE